jgi:hypothetical protein
MQKTIEMPLSLIHKISSATKAFEELEDALEDFLLSKDQTFIKKMRKAQKAHLAGKTKTLKELKKDLCIE